MGKGTTTRFGYDMKDLRQLVTVFVIVAGKDPNESICLDVLKKQTCKFKLDIIRDYMPMSKAFQEMQKRCTTPYYIQCDIDMCLNLNAVEHMYDHIAGNTSKPTIAMHCYLLKDVHLNKEIYGVKIYKNEIFQKYPYNMNHPSCEVEQLDRMKIDGFIHEIKPEVMGLHSIHWTKETIFERYFNLMEKFKLYRYIWLETVPKMLFDKVQKDPSEINISAYSGALASIYSNTTMDKEKDKSKKRVEYGRLLGFLDRPHQVTLYMTSKCNYKCTFCSRQHHAIEQAPDMSVETVETILCKFPEVQGYCLCGYGCPLMATTLIPVLQKLKAASKTVGIISNGSLLHTKLDELQSWYKPNYISVSLNCHNKEMHEAVTGTKTWDRVIENIKLLVNSNIEAYVSAVVSKNNAKHIPELIKLVHSLGVKTLHLHNLLPHFNEEETEYFDANVLRKEDQHMIDAWRSLPESSVVAIYPALIGSDRNGSGSCQFPWYSFAVNGNGSLSFCNSVLPCDKRWGNINDFVVWNSEVAQKFRDDFSKGNLNACKGCFRNYRWM